jgi:hypothetical protein
MHISTLLIILFCVVAGLAVGATGFAGTTSGRARRDRIADEPSAPPPDDAVAESPDPG